MAMFNSCWSEDHIGRCWFPQRNPVVRCHLFPSNMAMLAGKMFPGDSARNLSRDQQSAMRCVRASIYADHEAPNDPSGPSCAPDRFDVSSNVSFVVRVTYQVRCSMLCRMRKIRRESINRKGQMILGVVAVAIKNGNATWCNMMQHDVYNLSIQGCEFKQPRELKMAWSCQQADSGSQQWWPMGWRVA